MNNRGTIPLPDWVPEPARDYLAHTESGRPIRDLARAQGCHASTVLRQICRTEARRDDPLVDEALTALGAACFGAAPVGGKRDGKEGCEMTQADFGDLPPDAATLDREAARVLRRLCETGAVLAVADGMEKAVVVRDGADQTATRTAVVDCAIARAMALKDWIACSAPGRVSRYRITAAGRMALGRILAEQENRARAGTDQGMAEAAAAFGHRTAAEGETAGRPRRYSAAESPLIALARRRDRDGTPFLDDRLVAAGERLREDFELSQIGPGVAQNWDRFLTAGVEGGATGGAPAAGAAAARDRVARALADLGPGLSDVVLRCCCYLEGLETAEKKMGWSARSGKIVLRIALQRLSRHYERCATADRLIG